MGNQLATQASRPGVEHSAELVNAVFKETLGVCVCAGAYLTEWETLQSSLQVGAEPLHCLDTLQDLAGFSSHCCASMTMAGSWSSR